MSPTWEEVGEVFETALALAPEKRARFLTDRCRGDDALRREVESLLEQDADAENFLEPPRVSFSARLLGPTAGDKIGRYTVVRPIGQGVQGNVYEAQQFDPTRRVALKLLPPVSAGPTARNRLSRESEVLARMNHPAIAHVYEAGVEGDTPYIAMELVRDGVPITEYVRREKLSVRDTIALFRIVCDGVAHGHARGVLHRDLKPEHLLIGADGKPKIIDFGVARVLDAAIGGGEAQTQIGDVVGTLEYMSPEQAEGHSSHVGVQTDVHALALVLHELLCGRRARSIEGKTFTEAQRSVVRDDIPPARSVRPDLPAAIEWVLRKGVEIDRTHRYASVVEFDRELGRLLADEPVLAGPRSASYVAKLWLRRHPTATAVIAVATAALVTVGVLAARTAAREREVFRLADAEKLRALEREADRLWPARPANAAALEAWLVDARALLANLDEHRATLAELRARARPRSEAEARAEAESHELAPRLAERRREIAWRRAALARRRGEPAPELVPAADIGAYAGLDWEGLNNVADAASKPESGVVLDPSTGLALANAAMRSEGANAAYVRDTLRWVHWLGGQHAIAERMIDDEDPDVRDLPEIARSIEQLEAALAHSSTADALAAEEAGIRALEERVARAEAQVRARRNWTFTDESDAWWHGRLSDLVLGLERLADPETGLLDGVSAEHGRGVARRLEEIAAQGRAAVEHAADWTAVAARVASDDRYAGIALAPQYGLVPLGPDPVSGLEEFVDSTSGAIPRRDDAGRLIANADDGVVFVLVPAGICVQGAQYRDPEAPRYDADTDESTVPLRRLSLDAFFLSKYEVTQEQWMRATGSNPSLHPKGTKAVWGVVGERHPVEGVSWNACDTFLRSFGWRFPTEAQWEYAARAGTETVWWTGSAPESLKGAANLTDASCQPFGPRNWVYTPWLDDGAVVHAPVGSYAANAFGLHDVAGNVFEWCADAYARYDTPRRAGDGLVLASAGGVRVVRGAAYENNGPYEARSANRNSEPEGQGSGNAGLRPARSIED